MPTYISLPRAWWPQDWIDKGYKGPVCPLRLALYGHPKSGDLWHNKLEAVLLKNGFETMADWPSLYFRRAEGDLQLIIVYVDDLLLFGSEKMDPIIEQIRAEIVMEDLAPIDQYLGCNHRTATIGQQTHFVFDMSAYLKSAIEIYKEQTGLSVKPCATPFCSELPHDEFIKAVTTPGKWGKKAASFLMKLLYAARCAYPLINKPITSLASQICRWSVEADRRLHRIYEFLSKSLDLVLTGSLSVADRDVCKIRAYADSDLGGDVWSPKSTTGYWVEVQGADGRSFPLSWAARFQGSSSTHTCESETVSLCLSLIHI